MSGEFVKKTLVVGRYMAGWETEDIVDGEDRVSDLFMIMPPAAVLRDECAMVNKEYPRGTFEIFVKFTPEA